MNLSSNRKWAFLAGCIKSLGNSNSGQPAFMALGEHRQAVRSVSNDSATATTPVQDVGISESQSAHGSEVDEFTKEFMDNRIEITNTQRLILSFGASLASILDPHR